MRTIILYPLEWLLWHESNSSFSIMKIPVALMSIAQVFLHINI